MCIGFLYLNPNFDAENSWKLILISNRDEIFTRPSKQACWDQSGGYIAGQDLTPGREGGTWLAFSKTGRAGLLLNVTQPQSKVKNDAKPRGCLALDFVKNEQITSEEYLTKLNQQKAEYNAFNLLLLQKDRLKNAFEAKFLGSKDENGIICVAGGIHGLGNSESLDKPFQKVVHGLKSFQSVILEHMVASSESRRKLEEDLLNVLDDKAKHLPDKQLEIQACEYPVEFRKCLSSIFVSTPPQAKYGTRTQTVVLVDSQDNVSFYERNRVDFEDSSAKWEETRMEFVLEK